MARHPRGPNPLKNLKQNNLDYNIQSTLSNALLLLGVQYRGQVLIPLSVIVLLQRAPNTSRPVGSNFLSAPDSGRRDYDHPLVPGPPPSPAWNTVFLAVVFIVGMFGVGFVFFICFCFQSLCRHSMVTCFE